MLGIYKTQVKNGLRFFRLLEHEFCINDMRYAVSGADYPACQKLIVDISAQRSNESIKIEQCSRYMNSELNNTFANPEVVYR